MTGSTYPAITVWQPWATLIAADAKPFEFRHWPAPRRLWGKRIAIHAAARKMRIRELVELGDKLHSEDWLETGLKRGEALDVIDRAIRNPLDFPISSIVCLATLGEPIRNDVLAQQLGLPAIADSDRTEHTNWGWPLTDVEPLRPFVPARGQQGWWTWHEGVA